MNDQARRHAEEAFRDKMAPLLALGDAYPDATELVVDGASIKLDLGNSWETYDFGDFPGLRPKDIQAAANAAAVFAGVEFGPQPPAKDHISVKIPPDLRVSVVCPPASEEWDLTIRFMRSRMLTLEDYVASGVMTDGQALVLRTLVAEKKNLVISGGTSSGKTTLLRTLLELVSEERLIIIEDTPELSVRSANKSVRHWSTTSGSNMAALLAQAMRMRPDRIVVGEVRGAEALEVCTAANTGHDGVLSTLHSNGGHDTLRRLHNLCRRAQPNVQLEEIRDAVDYDVHLDGRGAKRRLSSIWEVPRE